MSHKNPRLPDIVEFTHFSFRTQTFITILTLYFHRCCIRQASFMISWFNQFIFIEILCMNVLFSLARIKSTWFKTFMSESIVHFKIPDNQCQNLNGKTRLVRERKCSGNINSLSGYQYRICTGILHLVTRKCRVMVFNATFNNISVISWRSVLLVDETGENHRPAVSHWQTLSHNQCCIEYTSPEREGARVAQWVR
jgi:hypothetical protein